MDIKRKTALVTGANRGLAVICGDVCATKHAALAITTLIRKTTHMNRITALLKTERVAAA